MRSILFAMAMTLAASGSAFAQDAVVIDVP
jgi:hypothetical protein